MRVGGMTSIMVRRIVVRMRHFQRTVFKNLTEWFIYLVIEDLASVSNLAPQVIEAGNDQDAQHRAQKHPPGSRGSNGSVSDRPSAGGKHQWNQTGNEGKGGHLNRPESQFPTFDGCLQKRQTLLSPLDGEFHNQNGVLAKQTDQHDQTDLGIDVVSQSHRLQEEEGAEDSDWQRKDNGQRQDEALVLPDQHQIDEGDDDQEDVNRLIALSRLIVGKALPAEAVTVRERLSGDLIDRLDGLTAAIAGRRRTLNDGARIQVIPGDLVQSLLLLDLHERGVGDHFLFVVLDEYVVQILGEAPKLWKRLDVDLVELVEANKALLVSAADEDVQVVQRLPDRHTLLHGQVVVDDQFVLRVVGGVEGEQVLQLLALVQGSHELLVHFSEPLVVGRIRLVEKHDGNTAGGTEAGNGGGFKELKLHVGHLMGLFLKILNDLARRPLAFVPGLQVDETGS